MGLASFNRMRRSRLPVEELETERFKEANRAHWEAHHSRSGGKKRRQADEKMLEKIEKAEEKAAEEIGRKAEEGIRMAEEGGIPDLPLRKDHAAEIVGRTLQHDPQGKPLDPIDRLHERVPPGATANETLAEKTSVDQDGPTREEVLAVEEEMLTAEEREMRHPPTKTVAAANIETAAAAGDSGDRPKPEKKTADSPASEPKKADDKTPSQRREEEAAAKKAEEAKLPAAGPAPDVGSKDGAKSEPTKTTSKK